MISLRVAKTENGLVRGLPAADPRITSFKGIPYAAPPVGENRWRPPQPARDWDGMLEAFEFSPIPMQARPSRDDDSLYAREWHVDPDIAMDEDCLYLNIWTPAASPDEKLPVFVWYYGGGLQVGHASEMEFDGERIARRGIVVVTVNYRLNAFGFLCHPDITAESPGAPANFGHLDQLFALKWVRRNIAAFGGDPDNVTIGGQSAGGGSVLALLTSPQTEGLFKRVIIQSGIIAPVYPAGRVPPAPLPLEEAEREGVRFFELLGVSSLAEARRLDASCILDRALASGGFWGTAIDGRFCADHPFDLLVQNRRPDVPILWGHTSSEFFQSPQAETPEELRRLAAERFGGDADAFLRLCGADAGDVKEAVRRASVSGIEYAIRVASRARAESGASAPLYYYVFDADIPGWDNPGTFHSVDLWFFFETLAKCWRPFVGRHYDLARQMCNYWAHYIRSGDPNGPDSTGEPLPRWEPYTEDAPYKMVFADGAAFVREGPSDVMAFLVDQYFKQRR